MDLILQNSVKNPTEGEIFDSVNSDFDDDDDSSDSTNSTTDRSNNNANYIFYFY